MKAIGQQYLAALENGDLGGILRLFDPGATVRSPIYGEQSPKAFFKALLRDTQKSEIEVQHIFSDEQELCMALYFTYHWTLKNGTEVAFDVVDILKLNAANLITSLTIIYDSSESSAKVSDMRSNK